MKETFSFNGFSVGKSLIGIPAFSKPAVTFQTVFAIIPTPYFIRR